MFQKILIANRGEIALRVIRACREMGIRSVAIYSEGDRDSLHVAMADEAICIGPPESAQSYLNIPRIMSAAEISKADAIHPGYGFLAENPHFAEVCQACKIAFVGPGPESIRLMGDKAQARQTVAAARVPVVQGSTLTVGSPEEARTVAAEIGYPVIIKAAAGGGGRGMRIVHAEADLARALQTAQGEAGVAFGNPAVYIERYVRNPRHVEFQILADAHGQVLHLGERDCSIQRRHQKLIEESPSPAMTATLREAMGGAAVASARAVGYVNAGTIEFLLDEDGRFYFMEMNTRIQVEHPVTEEVVGIDLVKLQIRIAAGEHLPFRQEEVVLRGHAIECRVNAEDPEEFLPSPGKITTLRLPGGPGIRVDTHAYAGYTIPPYYDSLVAKLIAHGQDRAEALSRMRRALQEFVVQGIRTTIPFHLRVMDHPDFVKGAVSTNFLERLTEASA
ncbi:MAG TPA: acetyl-CoA carboxylase biotin carboxylase subunit [Candidatus Methylomirabilis sp.]|jgi:acetyl-CoA carboxylase biotin carboxylase subunit|nr:acetyl-CoA carboxylase biotin carboxylase subunit [Candidatus Methylomirabilis sp.]